MPAISTTLAVLAVLALHAPSTAVASFLCPDVVAVPGNSHNVTDAECRVCNSGAYGYYPCDVHGLCYCESEGIPPWAVIPFTYCTKAVAVAGNADNVDDERCEVCTNASHRWYPCDQPNRLCECAEPTSSVSMVGGPGGNLLGTPWWNCTKVVATAGQSQVSDSLCEKCRRGEYYWYPCDRHGLCECAAGNGTGPVVDNSTAARDAFGDCAEVTVTERIANGTSPLKDRACEPCANAAFTGYPCRHPEELCTCKRRGGEPVDNGGGDGIDNCGCSGASLKSVGVVVSMAMLAAMLVVGA